MLEEEVVAGGLVGWGIGRAHAVLSLIDGHRVGTLVFFPDLVCLGGS